MRNHRTHTLPRLVLAGLTLLMMLLQAAPSALASAGCSNEQLRQESNFNPTTSQPYDLSLPECRAYEMVTPLEKQQHDAITITDPPLISVSPEGTAIQWTGQGAYAGDENYQVHKTHPTNPYLAQRTSTGWVTRSAWSPASLIEEPFPAFLSSGVYSPDLSSETTCGTGTVTSVEGGPAIRCALREPDGTWISTPDYTDLAGANFNEAAVTIAGASSTGEDIVLYSEHGAPFLPADTSGVGCTGTGHCGGIYEVASIGTDAPELRLVNVDNNGEMIGPENENAVGAVSNVGDAYHAVSADGSKIFFTATPSGGVPTIYARVNNTETVTVSAPECEGVCEHEQSEPAAYEEASANGEKVFFKTNQQLLSGDHDEGPDLYEYDFANPPVHRLVQVSDGGLGDVSPGVGADVLGVVSVSEDGSHVYFVAQGILTTLPNALGQTAAAHEADNLYAYDTDTGETKFVATLLESDKQLWGQSEQSGGNAVRISLAQTAPTGGYLVFDSYAKLITAGPEADTSGAQQVYRYDFRTGKLIRVSVGHAGYANNGNVPSYNAVVGPADVAADGASPTADETNRSISEGGETIAFVTAARLQASDVAGGSNTICDEKNVADDGPGCEVYVWHECEHAACAGGGAGEVNMVSDGQSAAGAVFAGMSATGADIFFETRAPLVGQDTDTLGDIYDARVNGGFPAPAPEPTCAEEACQGTPSPAPIFSAPGTASFTGSGNQTAPPFKEVLEPEAKSKSTPTSLMRALAKCRKTRGKAKRVKCERAARTQYGATGRRKGKK